MALVTSGEASINEHDEGSTLLNSIKMPSKISMNSMDKYIH